MLPMTPLEAETGMQTLRQRMIALLEEKEQSARELSGFLRISEKEVYEHLTHIHRSLAPRRRTLVVRPARCLDCSYVFRDRKRFTSPSRCPRCRCEHIEDPRYHVRTGAGESREES